MQARLFIPTMAPIFVSYRSDDAKAWALMLASELADKFGERQVFLDKDDLSAGKWRAQIDDALATCSVMLVVIGRNWLTAADLGGRRRLDDPDDVHRYEVVSALDRNLTVVPVLVDGAPIPLKEQLPIDLGPLTEQQARTLADDRSRRSVDFQNIFADVERATGLTVVKPQGIARGRWGETVAAGARTGAWTLLTAALASVVALLATDVGLGWTLDRAERGVIVAVMVMTTLAVTWTRRRWRGRKPRRSNRAAASLIGLAVVRLGHPDLTTAQPIRATSITCAPDSPLIHPGESVVVRTATADESGRPLPGPINFTWTASAGDISGGETARWSFRTDDAAGGPVQATARVSVRTLGMTSDCTVSLLVVQRGPTDKPTDRGNLVAARTFLLAGAREETGYGLYSYLLMSVPPRNSLERDRALQTIQSLLLILQPATEMERYRRRSEMNAVLIPMRQPVSSAGELAETAEAAAEIAARVLPQYDYVRAQSLMAEFGIDAPAGGPFIVARTSGPDGPRTQLSMDISHVAPKLASDWMAAFLRLTAQERSWTDVALQKLLLNTRNLVAGAARESPEVIALLGGWFRLGRS
jgi:hypothetical protein